MSELLEQVSSALADRYRIESEIGRGGMATVFLAEDLKHHRQVAIKVLHPDLAATLGADRFLREIEITARLSHPLILPLLDSWEVAGHLYYVMPFVSGPSLRDRLSDERPPAVDEILFITGQVASALEAVKQSGCCVETHSKTLQKLCSEIDRLQTGIEELEACLDKAQAIADPKKRATAARDQVIPAMQTLRQAASHPKLHASGVSESQNVPPSSFLKRLRLKKTAENSPRRFPSSLPMPS